MHKIGYWGIVVLGVVMISCNPRLRINADEPELGNEEFEIEFLEHKRWMYDCLKKYIEYSSFVDASSRVSVESIEAFKNLFIDNARVWNDYLWEPKYEYANVYADQIYYFHRIKGLKVSYEDDVLERFYTIKYEDLKPKINKADPSNLVYKYTYNLRKGVYYILNKDQKVIYYNEPIEYDLDFIFYVSSREEKAFILDILARKN